MYISADKHLAINYSRRIKMIKYPTSATPLSKCITSTRQAQTGDFRQCSMSHVIRYSKLHTPIPQEERRQAPNNQTGTNRSTNGQPGKPIIEGLPAV